MRLVSTIALVFVTSNCFAEPITAAAPRVEEPTPTAKFAQAYASWNDVLAKHVKGGGFDYAGLKKDRAKLDATIAALEATDAAGFATWSAKERFAFWINAYNAYTVKRVVDAYPIASIKDLGDEKQSVWDRELAPLGGLAPDLKKSKLTLNDIENLILRPAFRDARVHAAINCASEGCPPLRAEAFVAAKLDAQLDEQVKRWLSDGARNRFDKAAQKLELSSIFDWFKADFEREAGSAQAWIARFRPDDASWLNTKKKLAVTFLDYSWKLNDAR